MGGSHFQQDQVVHKQGPGSRAKRLLLVSLAYGRSVVSLGKLLSPPESRSSGQKSSVRVCVFSKNSPFSLFNHKYHVFCALFALFCTSESAMCVYNVFIVQLALADILKNLLQIVSCWPFSPGPLPFYTPHPRLNDSYVCPDRDGITVLRLTNPSGFTCRLEEGSMVGSTEPATLSSENVPDNEIAEENPSELQPSDTLSSVKKVEAGPEWRKEKLYEMYKDSIDLPQPAKESFLQFLSNHHEAFSLEENERGETDLLEMEIDTGDAPPKKQRPRRMPFAVRQEVSKQLKKMQEAQVIWPSKSPWASPIVSVRKRDGTHRFCIDYRELNSVTKPDTYPLPRIEDLLDQLGESCYFSTLDLSSGFWQIRIHPDSVEKTAFTTPQGLFEFRVMPFGLTNAPGVFQRLMQQVLMGLNPEDGPDFVSVYIDDVLVFSKTLEEHLHHLEMVLKRIIEVGLKLKPVKCQFPAGSGIPWSYYHSVRTEDQQQTRDCRGSFPSLPT